MYRTHSFVAFFFISAILSNSGRYLFGCLLAFISQAEILFLLAWGSGTAEKTAAKPQRRPNRCDQD
jgi:hypothetical protein